ncbi:uncharacterized protein LOC127779561 isoform X3 [Oryza glaberrima]|uniref:uncharacterized protein LOC127779561 isoform X3 n=1 Tax=Oryza glaberrima TaxID=4538 RepID=UPI00224C465E|nr:uncharacterized protein LOC127779561 isoform X3 [Oryza glaberrima]
MESELLPGRGRRPPVRGRGGGGGRMPPPSEGRADDDDDLFGTCRRGSPRTKKAWGEVRICRRNRQESSTEHPPKEPTGSSGEILLLQKEHHRIEEMGSTSSAEMLHKHPSEETAPQTGSSGETPQKLQAKEKKVRTENHQASGEKLQKLRANGKAGMSSTGVMPQKLRAEKGSSGGTPQKLQAKGNEGTSSIGGVMLQKHQAKQEMAPSRLLHHPPRIQVQGVSNRGAQVATTSRQKHAKINKSSTTRASEKLRSATNSPSQKTDTASSSNGNIAPHGCKEPARSDHPNNIVHAMDDKDSQEADDAIKRLNELGLGENISSEEFAKYIDQLVQDPKVDTSTKLDRAQLASLHALHARHRIKYYKESPEYMLNTECKGDSYHTKLLGEDEISDEFITEMGFFMRLEKDGTFDWCFFPDYCLLAALDDYQRLVPLNGVDWQYAYWDDYHSYLNSYKTEQQYLKYCKALSMKLKWMEDYVLNELPSLKWGMICTRGAYQAIKIATNFSGISGTLAYNAYYHMRFYVAYCKDMDGLYFEIWQRVNKQNKSFRDSLEEVYNLNMFPSLQDKMKYALENDCSYMENEFHICTASVTSEITEGKALELIAEAVENRTNKPKFYEQYIQRKIDIAQAIGLVSTDGTEAA